MQINKSKVSVKRLLVAWNRGVGGVQGFNSDNLHQSLRDLVEFILNATASDNEKPHLSMDDHASEIVGK